MKKYHIQYLLLFAMMVPFRTITVHAQQLTRYEYWFDNGYSSRHSASLSGYTAVINDAIDTQQLGDGLHTFFLRVKQDDGYYSPVAATAFLKFHAQEGSMLEYWFDDDFLHRGAIDVEPSKGDEMQTLVLDLQDDVRFPIGVHRLNCRVAVYGSYYSPVYGGDVMKMPSGDVYLLEYWLDDDFHNRGSVTTELADSTELKPVEFDLADNLRYPIGMHRLNFRVVAHGGSYSPVYSGDVMKLPSGDIIKLEYWFDDNYEGKNVASLKSADGKTSEEVQLDLQNHSNFPFGVHRLNTRVVIEGCNSSPVYSSWLTKMSAGTPSQFEYWVDNDYTNRKTLSGTVTENGATFNGTLDLSKVKPGVHRLFTRCTSNSNMTNSAVSVTYIMVKSLYNADAINTVVTQYRYWVDDEVPTTANVSSPSAVFLHPFSIDASQYANGVHKLNLQYANSANVWSAVNQTYFATEHPAAYWMPEGDWTIVENQQTIGDLSLAYCNGLLSIDCDSPELNGVSTVCVYSMSGLLLLQEEADSSDGLHVQLSLETPEDSNVVVRITSGSCHYSGKLHCTK